MSLGNNIKYARKAAGLTQEDIAREIGVSKQTVQKYESGIITTISSDKIEIIAKLLRTTPAKLMGWEDNTSAQSFKLFSPNVTDDVVTFPVLGSIAAGYNEMAIEDWSGETIDVPRSFLKGRSKSDFFVLKVHGDSMYPIYHTDDKVLILRQTFVERSGDVGAVIYDGECATLKRVEIFDDMVRLSPLNPSYPPKELTGANLEQYHIIGVPYLLVREIIKN
ncbi:MAG: S24 family peptidase [Acutalibacteraceae bacterium]|mgnify:FL=1|nr:S24 family peptidase [Acutalibacteraceae bacterium]DAQ58437.1 MAG TPA: Repressor protein CI [Caudoviricetes sp.]DAZ61003.1 MAG TPA: Repressor protein CI [Caudoviricetes sp.]